MPAQQSGVSRVVTLFLTAMIIILAAAYGAGYVSWRSQTRAMNERLDKLSRQLAAKPATPPPAPPPPPPPPAAPEVKKGWTLVEHGAFSIQLPPGYITDGAAGTTYIIPAPTEKVPSPDYVMAITTDGETFGIHPNFKKEWPPYQEVLRTFRITVGASATP